jgi:hypothetical protein
MKKRLITLVLILVCIVNTYSQSNEIIAKSYFIKAQENYGNNNFLKAISYLDKCLDKLGVTNPKIEAMYVRLKNSNELSIERKKHLDSYFKEADETHSDYMEMLELAVIVNENAANYENNIKQTEKQSIEIEPLWKIAKQKNTIESYKKFLNSTESFSHNKFKEEAQSKLELRIEAISININEIEISPVFENCYGSNDEIKSCFYQKIRTHFTNNFDANLPNTLGLNSGRKRIFLGFSIDQNGNIQNINARTAHKSIQKEVIRVMNLLPEMKPGINNGKNMITICSMQFTIKVD